VPFSACGGIEGLKGGGCGVTPKEIENNKRTIILNEKEKVSTQYLSK
jgi:hypothetical protein